MQFPESPELDQNGIWTMLFIYLFFPLAVLTTLTARKLYSVILTHVAGGGQQRNIGATCADSAKASF